MNIPEILKTVSGKSIDTAEKWETFRRPEIKALFENFVFGVRSVERPKNLEFKTEVKDENLFSCMRAYEIKMSYKNGERSDEVPFWAFLPKETNGEKLPVFAYALLERQAQKYDLFRDDNVPFLPLKDIINRGYGVIAFPVFAVAPNEGNNHEFGVCEMFDAEVKPNSWGTISAWAWGLSRVADYIETNDRLDKTKIIAIGHSRGGKTALWASATDERFAMAISSCSGCTGAAVSRGTTGEKVSDINRVFPYWFCDNYKKYNDNEDFLPIDQYMLLALTAPRPLYVSSAADDYWACPENELLATKLCDEVYKLYGKKGAVIDGEVRCGVKYHDGDIGYHVIPGPHALTVESWQYYMDFADKKLNIRRA